MSKQITINEASLGRVYQHVVSKPNIKSWAMMTANRYSNTSQQNAAANSNLESDLKKMGYGFFKVEGMWQECQNKDIPYHKCPPEMLVPSKEPSYFVPGITPEHAHSLGNKYEQDSVLYADEETKKKGEANLMFKDGSSQRMGKFEPNRVRSGYSKMKGGSTFTFAPGPEDKEFDAPSLPGPRGTAASKANPSTSPKSTVDGDTATKLRKLHPDKAKGVLGQTIQNPDTGNPIKVSSALRYDKSSEVYKRAKQMIHQAA